MEQKLKELGVNSSDIILKAFKLAENSHKGIFRKSLTGKVEYINHPVTVALILKNHINSKCIESILCASLLHDVVEDSDVTIEEIEKEFGKFVSEIVFELTTNKEECKRLGKANYLLQKMIKMSNISLKIKLADRLDNVNDLFDFIKSGDEKTKRFALNYIKETKFIAENLKKMRMLTKTQSILLLEIENKINFL
jgi:guanosine-3',5'-bis(diphosphate) 3'-pyrophosphohydrolase